MANSKDRSYNMSRIKGKNTGPEMIIRSLLWKTGYRYQLHVKDLPGKPDIIFRGKKKAIFINGCFWHMHDCKNFKWPKTNIEFWKNKINNNAMRDTKNYLELSKKGWVVLIIWQCEIEDKRDILIERLIKFIG